GAPAPEACGAARAHIVAAGFASVDYVACVEEESLVPVTAFDAARPARVLAAARLGRTRLIDNVPVNP
ncbi:MAG: pantoate--beta-alanine ligase, partial [Alphaproteobacteria bacterium]|nr:pantoate--beta-alanine ligase [Alphaproteobacteria bacterium]